jgi:proline dehydrogenase
MIGLARSDQVKRLIQGGAGGSALAGRYVAGAGIGDGIQRAERLRDKGLLATLFYLGEYVDRPELVARNVEQKLAVAEALGKGGLDTHVSVDPTQIGYQLSPGMARRNAWQIAEQIARVSNHRPGVHCLMLDMEDETVVDETIALHDDLRLAGLPAALTVQAYLRRTEADLEAQIARGSHVRLVKGAFGLRGGPAYSSHAKIKENYRRLVQLMLSPEAREAGFYPSIGTHDTSIHILALELADKNGWRREDFEFEMLLGVRTEAALRLAEAGARVRLYTPFGEDWWPHAARRIGESPANAWLLLRSLLSNASSADPLETADL